MNEEVKTPEEIALEIWEETGFSGWDDLRADIAQAIRDAYERAAKMAEDWPDFRQHSADACAKAIRALKGKG